MLTSMAATFIAATQDGARDEADKLFAQVFGKDGYAVRGIEITPYELSEPYTVLVDAADALTGEKAKAAQTRRDTLSWQATFAAHRIA